MSYLNKYRINFAGGFSTNVNTANNAYPGMMYTDPLNSMLTDPILRMTDEQAIAFLKQKTPGGDGLNSEWNYMGDYETKFVNAKVTSAGLPGRVSEKTELKGTSVYLLGSKGTGSAVMVDLDPTGGGIASQLFSGGIQIGDGDSAVKILYDNVSYSYFLGNRLGAKSKGFKGLSVWYQFAIPKAFVPRESSNHTLNEFFKMVHDGDGLVIRITPFEVMYAISELELAKEFDAGNAPSNPAIGYLIGTISVWLKDEITTSPPGRLLNNRSDNYSDALADVDVSNGILSLDLANAIPKADYRQSWADVSNIGANVDVGLLKIINGGTKKEVAQFTPDPVNYWKTGGIVDVQLDKDSASSLVGQPIVLTDGKPGSELVWTEDAYRIESAQRGMYLDDPSASTTVKLKITEFGRQPTQQVTVALSTVSSSFFPRTWPDPKNMLFAVNGTQGDHVDLPPGTSEASVKIYTNGSPGISQLEFNVNGPFGNGLFEAVVRVFPTDDYSTIIGEGPISWDLVYKDVLRFYYVIFPAMSLRFPLNRPEIVTIPAIAAQIKARMDSTTFGSTGYMPITRSMSPGKRKLLFAFLDNPALSPAATKISALGVKPISWRDAPTV